MSDGVKLKPLRKLCKCRQKKSSKEEIQQYLTIRKFMSSDRYYEMQQTNVYMYVYV